MAFGGRVLFASDFHLAFEPLRGALGRAWRSGLPLWNPALGSGETFVASPFAAALYPPNLVFATDLSSPARLLSLLAVGHALWGALGTWLLLRRRGRSEAASALGAGVVALAGPALSATSYVLLATTASWLPWLFLLETRLGAARGRRARIGAAVVFAATFLATLLSGEPFVLAAGLLGLSLSAALSGAERPPRHAARLALAAGAALLVASPWLVAVGRHLAASERSVPLGPGHASTWSLHPLEAPGLLFPRLYGNPMSLGEDRDLAAALHGGSPPLLASLYVGLLVAGLAALGAARAREEGAARADALLLVALVLLALGRHGPLAWLPADVPVLSAARFPVKWLVPAVLPLALLAARGLDRLVEIAAPPRGGRVVVAALALLALPAVLAAGSSLGLGRAAARALAVGPAPEDVVARAAPAFAERFASSAARSAVPFLASAAVAALAIRRGRPGAVPPVLAALGLLDLAFANAAVVPTERETFYARVPEAAARILGDGSTRVWADASAEARAATPLVPGDPDLARGFRDRLAAYTGAAYGLSLAFDLDLEHTAPLPYARLRSLVETAPPRERAILLAAASVTHVASVLDRNGPGLEPLPPVSGAEPGVASLRVWRVPSARPRVRFATEVLAHDGPDDLVAALRARDASLADAVALDRRDGPAPPIPPAGGRVAAIVVDVDRPGDLVVRVSGPAGYLVIADAWTPGWDARVDGATAPVLVAWVGLRAVPVPAGAHRVTLRYRPFF